MYKKLIELWKELGGDQFLERFFPLFAYSSNKIENDETSFTYVEKVFKGEKITDERLFF
ncbi:hypothetical protein N3C_2643 [Clostridium sp. N3C]|uniref:hypothetical protein n=1 Tax=Clostridium sp. N3C TaxID=1776758 RepID=UPI00092DFA7D|nr:hypothetical protein [Clostridium sp. N3C]SCN26036.1 hypothetical protein N3C_2643 [Clostridium sp. N3C]